MGRSVDRKLCVVEPRACQKGSLRTPFWTSPRLWRSLGIEPHRAIQPYRRLIPHTVWPVHHQSGAFLLPTPMTNPSRIGCAPASCRWTTRKETSALPAPIDQKGLRPLEPSQWRLMFHPFMLPSCRAFRRRPGDLVHSMPCGRSTAGVDLLPKARPCRGHDRDEEHDPCASGGIEQGTMSNCLDEWWQI